MVYEHCSTLYKDLIIIERSDNVLVGGEALLPIGVPILLLGRGSGADPMVEHMGFVP